VQVQPTDTGQTLYEKLERAGLTLFAETWPAIRNGAITPETQDKTAGSVHRISDVAKLDEIDLDRNVSARELINILRARTFPPYRGAYFLCDGRRIFLSLTLQEENPEDAAP
jgi:methionyl-tRNA formyltransferase